MAVDARARATIARPRDEVAAYATDPAHDTEWIQGIREAEPLTPPPFGAGTKVRRVAAFLGRRIDYALEVVEYAPGERVVMETAKPFPMRVTYSFADDGDGTLAEVRVQGEASGFFRLASPLLNAMVRRNIAGDVRRLKALLESGAGAPGEPA